MQGKADNLAVLVYAFESKGIEHKATNRIVLGIWSRLILTYPLSHRSPR